MPIQASDRMFFTFRSNGTKDGRELVEVTVEKLDEHEPPAEAAAEKQNWFGTDTDLESTLQGLEFSALNIEGVLSTLKVNKIATREVEASFEALASFGFAAVA